MPDFNNNWRVQQILIESAQYRTLRAVYDADPKLSPGTVDVMRRCFQSHRDDPRALREIRAQVR
jgi:hypothetical protein